MLDALAASYARTEDPAAAEPLLQGLLQLALLAGLLGLDGLCEQAVGAVASAAGVFAPAAPGSAAERQQLSALHTLLSLPAGPEAGLLGSSWVIVLRCVSALEALHQELTRPLPAAPPAPPKDAATGTSAFGRMFGGLFGGGAAAAAPTSPPPPAQLASPQQQQQQLASPPGAGAPWGGTGPPRDSLDGTPGGPAAAPATIRAAPGAGLAAWAASADGQAAIGRVYSRSAGLDGDAVVVFMRALCAVSQEELEAPGGPRLHSLQKVVECAFMNMGRIRLVWSKVWAVASAQLVGASCSQHRAVALYAVDALRQLVAKLLARAELAHFAHQVRLAGGGEGARGTPVCVGQWQERRPGTSPPAGWAAPPLSERACPRRRPAFPPARRRRCGRLSRCCGSATSPRCASWLCSA
jgi:brefeldin A-inhibited guanine nucleotide-exchange protein